MQGVGPARVQEAAKGGGEQDEAQTGALGLDARARTDTIATDAWCSVSGINERRPVRLLIGERRGQVLDARKDFMTQYFSAIAKIAGHTVPIVFGISVAGSEKEKFLKLRDDPNSPIVVLQCPRAFPNESAVKLMVGTAIESRSGIPTSQPQSKDFQVRPRLVSLYFFSS